MVQYPAPLGGGAAPAPSPVANIVSLTFPNGVLISVQIDQRPASNVDFTVQWPE